MSANHIPHLLTHLLTEAELDTLRTAFLDRAAESTGAACKAWMDAVMLIDEHRSRSFQRRAAQTPSGRRKSLGYRPTADR
jgi:hypothetical protein